MQVVDMEQYKLLVFRICIMIFLLLPSDSETRAEEVGKPKVVVIYTTADGEITEEQRYLDMLIGHFTSDIRFISSDDVVKSDFSSATHLFYFGQASKRLPAKFETLFDEYEGKLIAIGYNSEMLGDQFKFVTPKHEVTIDQISMRDSGSILDVTKRYIIEMEAEEGADILLTGSLKDEGTDYPVMVEGNGNYYYAFNTLDSSHITLFAEVLHNVFENAHQEIHPGYIRLEDVHPLVDPKPLREIAEMLKERNIPYMVAVIPIYTNHSTGKRTTFADSPELLKVLKQMQQDGGSIVLHGYTHQFRASETGEGFEFWDVENNSPIYFSENQAFSLKEQDEFSTREKYEDYINDLKAYEREYTETKLNQGIDELTKYGLYPLAFEAPHYTMSQHGYQILSEHFSTYVGHIQLSDRDWEIMDTSPYITSPSFLNGMRLLPETMGYIRPNIEQAVQKMMDHAKRLESVRDGMFAAFYHPYLGSEGFKELLDELGGLPDVSWIDLKETDVWVKSDNVSIHTENGEIIADFNPLKVIYSSQEAPLYYFGQFVRFAAWIMVAAGSVIVCLFIAFTIRLMKRNKQLEG